MSFLTVLRNSFDAYGRNIKLISFFSIPFLIVFPLSLILPNFVSMSGIFLRFGSIQGGDLTPFDSFFIILVFLVALFLFSFALVSINTVIRSQRTLTRLVHEDLSRLERGTIRLFSVFLLFFFVILVVNLFLYNLSLHTTVGAFVSLIISLLIVFAPQAIAVDDLGVYRSIEMSLSIILRRFSYFVFFVLISVFLVVFNTLVFLWLEQFFAYSRFVSLVTNSLVILPFLEVLKSQIYLSKYTLLHKMR